MGRTRDPSRRRAVRIGRDQLDALALLLGIVAVAALADIVLVVLDDHLGGSLDGRYHRPRR